MPQDFSSTLKNRRRQAQRVGRSPQPAPAPPLSPPSPPASLRAPGMRFSPVPASASPPLPTRRLGEPLSPLLQCLLPTAASSFSPPGTKATATAGSWGCILLQNLQQHNWKGKRLVRAHLPEIRLAGRNLDFIPPTAASSISCLQLPEVKLSSDLNPGKWDPENSALSSFQISPWKTHRWHSPLQGAFPVFSPASCHHGYCLQRSFPASVSLTLGCKVIFTRLARMLSRGLIIIVLL